MPATQRLLLLAEKRSHVQATVRRGEHRSHTLVKLPHVLQGCIDGHRGIQHLSTRHDFLFCAVLQVSCIPQAAETLPPPLLLGMSLLGGSTN